MNRLKYYLLHENNGTSTYSSIYEGETVVNIPPKYDALRDEYIPYPPEIHHMSRYFSGDIALDIDLTNKLAQDKPTLTWHIPIEKLGFSNTSVAAADYCLRAFAPYIDFLNAELYNKKRPDKENGRYYLVHPGGEVLVRNAAYFSLISQRDYEYSGGNTVNLIEDGQERSPKTCLSIMMQVQLPKGKLRKATQMLCRDLPDAVDMFVSQFDVKKLEQAAALAERQTSIRHWLKNSDYCAFIANGSILPRSKGTQAPMQNAIPFCSVPEDEIEIDCGKHGSVRGMGIRRGVTVITGGGYSGKSTLLDAISAGIYNHASGDGRELCITDDSAVTISAENGRSIRSVNVSPFIKWIPNSDTQSFSTDRASGSTSQAANIMEAVNAGSKLLLIDEDRSAANFMIRDNKMKELIKKEPITPFTDRAGELFHAKGVSTILVIGGSGEYLSIADRVYMMDDFVIRDVTERSKQICQAYGTFSDFPPAAVWSQNRIFLAEGFTSYPENSGSERLVVSDMGFIFIGDEKIDLRSLRDIITERQLNALGFMLRYLEISNRDSEIRIAERIDELYLMIEREGLDAVYSGYFTDMGRFMDLPRKCDLMAVVNRMRGIGINGGNTT